MKTKIERKSHTCDCGFKCFYVVDGVSHPNWISVTEEGHKHNGIGGTRELMLEIASAIISAAAAPTNQD